ncbi:MAG: hypothetical protein EOQ56_19230 [Mesorhizobium sp.]|nr:MAG: hypothetical protein EOQ56_19230 [Mesorhizobium sp.]
MKKAAIEKANSRLAKARESVTAIGSATTYPSFQSAWTDFLLAANAIYSILERGAKGNQSSINWFGRAKGTRRKDPLLQYIHHARNADEHGIAPVTELVPGSVSIKGVGGNAVHIENLVINDGNFRAEVKPVNGSLPSITLQRPTAKLISVTDDRFGDTFDPPTHHLGTPILENSPLAVAELAIAYLATMMLDAEQLLT